MHGEHRMPRHRLHRHPRRRLSSAAKAVKANPDSAEIAAIYQARHAEAVAYLGSGQQEAR